MASAESVIYKGITYYPKREHGYYVAHHPLYGETYLHRVVWADRHGPIPEYMHVHHKNGNRKDNRISNLKLMSPSKHMKLHMRKLRSKLKPLKDGSKRKIDWMQIRIDKSNEDRIVKLKYLVNDLTGMDICPSTTKLVNALLADKLICELRRYEKKP